jgi:hypothetical protein
MKHAESVTFGGSGLDRAAQIRGDTEKLDALRNDPTTRILPIWNGKPAIDIEGGTLGWISPDHEALSDCIEASIFLGLDEGTAVFGSELVMPYQQRLIFEREVLFPMAGLDPNRVEEYYQIDKFTRKLRYAATEAARKYLDGSFSDEEAISWLMTNELISRERALQRLKFFRQYRSYVINYTIGYTIVKHYIESNGGTSDNIELRWKLFSELLSAPLTPSDLINETKTAQ